MADNDLARRVQEGDVDALGEFIIDRRPQLLAYIYRQLSDALRRKIEPDDLLQEVSAEAVRSLHSIDLSERDPFSWLCQVAQRRIIDAHRKHFGAQKRDAGREISIDSPSSSGTGGGGMVNLLVASMTTASAAFSRDQKEFKMLAAISTLPEEQREALRLRYIEGLPSKEIAKQLGKSDGAVRVMLTRSLSKLEALLGPDAAPRG